MYLSAVRAHDAGTRQPAATAVRAVPAAVVGLGVVSLLTDLSAEMITAVLPLFLVYGLGAGYLQLGLVDGLYTGATIILRLAGGYVADRIGRPKAVAVTGYAISAVSKLGFPLAGTSMSAIGVVIAADRAGKGIRTAPRDALITMATPPASLGRAFGVHRAMDAGGAMLGPLAAFALISIVADGYDTVFATSFCAASIAVVVLAFFVRVPVTTRAPSRQVSLRAGLSLLVQPQLLRLCAACVLLGLLTIGDMLLLLAVQQRAGLPSAVLPLLPLGIASTFMVAAIPVGRLADRIGRWWVYIGGHGMLLGTYALVWAGGAGWLVAGAALILHGLFYAATDGVLMAFAGARLAAPLRASGLAIVQSVQVLSRALGAATFGVVAHITGLTPALAGYTLFLAMAIGATVALTHTLGRTEPA